MATVNVPLVIQDPATTQAEGMPRSTEGFEPDEEDFFLDGPVTARLAVLDFDPDTGQLAPGAHYNKGDKIGWYEDKAGDKLGAHSEMHTPEFMQVACFAAVLKTMYMFEQWETMGRELTWAFDAPQLLIVPRAGEDANAYYHRDSHSLQFFYFAPEARPHDTIFTCLVRDIVAHETGHAIIDGIVPDLQDASTPESLAMHEAIADLTALLMAFESEELSYTVLKQTDGSIRNTTAFSAIAEEFGIALGRRIALRSLNNEKNLNPDDPEHCVSHLEPHDLSEVLSGALFRVMVEIHEDLTKSLLEEYGSTKWPDHPNPRIPASGLALRKGSERFKRMIFRALDYLPPGEVSFADYGRALIAVDRVAYISDPKMRDWVRNEFIRRHIVPDVKSLEAQTRFMHEAFQGVDIETLYAEDWVAYDIVNRNRDLFGIPPRIPFMVRPRMKVSKKYDDDKTREECIFKVAWDQVERADFGLASKRQISVGTTLAIDWETGEVLARLSNARVPRGLGRKVEPRELRHIRAMEYKQQRQYRDDFLRHLDYLDLLVTDGSEVSPMGNPMLGAIRADVSEGIIRLSGTGHLLHIATDMPVQEVQGFLILGKRE